MSAAAVESTRFRFEADMLPALYDAAETLTAGLESAEDRIVMFEVPAFESVPDMTMSVFDAAAVERRGAWGGAAVTDPSSLQALIALTAGVTYIDDVASHVRVSRSHLRRSILPSLAQAGWTAPLGARDRAVALLHPYESLVPWVVTVEAKRAKWRDAVSQARRHLRAADRVFVALDAAHITPAAAVSVELAREGIGLVGVDAASQSATLVRRPRKGHRPDPHLRAVVGERMWEMHGAGVRIGRTSHVFGQVLPMRVPYS